MTSMDFLIIGIFLLITLIIGLYYGRGIKTFQDYAVGNRKMPTLVLTLSMIATIYDGGILHTRLDAYYRQGIYALLLDLNSVFNLYLASRFVISRMKEFIGHLSIAESMGELYGPVIRIVTAVLGIMMATAILAAQIKVALNITQKLMPSLHTWSNQATIVWVSLVILYASFGGARSVAFTDVYQFLLFGLCFPLLIFICLFYAKHETLGWQKLTAMPAFNISKVCTWDDTLVSVLACFIWRSIIPFDPARMQRFYMSSSVTQAIKIFNQTAISRIIIPLLFLSLAVALHVGNYTIESGYNAFYYIIDFAHFPGVRGLFVTVIFALLMSTADSNLHAASILFSNDLWPFLNNRTKKHSATQPSLKVVRMASILIGLISLVVALHTTHVMHMIVNVGIIYGAAVSIPFIMACLGFRPRTMVILCGACINSVIALGFFYCKVGQGNESTNTSPFAAMILLGQKIFFALMASVCILLLLHYLFPKLPGTGWIGIKDCSLWDLQNQTTKRWWLNRWRQLKAPFTKAYRSNVFPNRGSTFILLGIYIIVSSIIALCFMKRHYLYPYIYGYMALMAVGTMVTIYPALHSYRQGGNTRLHWLWPILLFLLLFIAPIQFVKLGHYSPTACVLWLGHLGIATVLLSLEVSSVMLCLAMLIHKFIPPFVSASDPLWSAYKEITALNLPSLVIEFLYATALGLVIIVGLSIYKYLRDKSTAKLRVIELTRTYEHRISLEAIYNQANWSRLDATHGNQLLLDMSHALEEPYRYLATHGQEKLSKNISNFLNKLHKFGKLHLWKAQLGHGIELNQNKIKRIAWEDCLLTVHDHIRTLDTDIQLLLNKQTNRTQLWVDPELFECFLMLNLWEMSQCAQTVEHTVTATIADSLLQYNYDRDTPAADPLRLPALAFCFTTDTKLPQTLPVYNIAEPRVTAAPLTDKHLYQIECRQMVEAHGGYVAIQETADAIQALYVLPIEGQKVMRFKNYDPVYLAAHKQAETAESIAQENELIALLANGTTLTKEKIIPVIAFIKNAHGLVMRQSGEPYYTHPMAVTKLLLTVTKNPITLLAGLLHDVVEDTPVTLHQVELMYGAEVATLVDQVTHYNTNGYPWKLDKEEKKNRLNQCDDVRVVQIKLADRLHNMRTLSIRKWKDQQRIAQETLLFYVPWGEKHKIAKEWTVEMKQICEKILSNGIG
ncbi:sodium:solute symporter family protein [Candidatus Cardinium hertigii]|uniref:GTP pyrophosphokinase n=1 Tax=Candidatus Cardinium hertigii TaxID=247481 RepID=A0A2Z3LD28_9BACT|nr:sodium:solute symporter family protein [Candidatus Cardinium hertigii]AWN82042.1 GTP pyrophosphokinase [Candidatus Cardinium hertigii]